MAEVRISPDGQAVAIKRDLPPDDPRLWAVMTTAAGGHYGAASEVESWPIAYT